MAVQDYKINYKSDFVLTINGDAGWAIPFCIKFWTGMPSQAYFVGFDGVKYVNCRVGDTPTQLLVMFDDHHLPIGKLKMQIAYHTTIEEFPGSVFDEVTNARDVIVTIDGTDYQVLLDFTGEDAPELEFNLPAYANEAERIQNELQRQQNEADRIAAELQREQATAAAVQGAENVNAQLSGNILTVTNRQGVSTSVNTKGEQGEQGPVGPEGPQGEQGVSIVDFSPKSQTTTTLIYTATFSDGHTQDVAIPKGPKGDTGATGPTGPQGPQGQTGVSITGLVKTGETETDTLYNVTFSNGTTQAVAIPKGEKGDQGPAGPQGPQGPMGDVAVITPEQQTAFTMYSVPGQNTDGPMTQKAVTDNLVAGSISYDNSASGLASNNVQGALDKVVDDTEFEKQIAELSFFSTYADTNYPLFAGHKYRFDVFLKDSHVPVVSIKDSGGNIVARFDTSETGNTIYYIANTDSSIVRSALCDVTITELVMSGNATEDCCSRTDVIESSVVIDKNSCVLNRAINADGTIRTTGVTAEYYISNFIEIPSNANRIVHSGINNYTANFSYGCLYDSSKNLLYRFQGDGIIDLANYPSAKYIAIGILTNVGDINPVVGIQSVITPNEASVIDTRHDAVLHNQSECATVGVISGKNGIISTSIADTSYLISDYIDLEGYDYCQHSLWNEVEGTNFTGAALYDESHNPVKVLVGEGIIYLKDYPSARYVVIAIHSEHKRVNIELGKGYRMSVKSLAEKIPMMEDALMYESGKGTQMAGNVDTSVNTISGNDYYAMGVAGSAAEYDGNITSVSFCAQNTGTIHFMIGVWDETHEYFNPRATYNYSVSSTGNQTMPVNIPILQGETLMVNMSSGVKIKWKQYFSTPPAGSKNAIISVDGGQIYHKYGPLRTYLSWTIAWEFEQTLTEKVTENANDIEAVGNECERIGQQVSELANSKLLIQGNDGKVYRLIVTDGVLGIENTTPQNILILAHSFACILTGVWQRGMSSSKIATDWVSQMDTVFLPNTVNRVNMRTWEQAFPNPSSQLSSLNSYLTTSVDAIFIMCGANVPSAYRTQQYGQTNYAELVNYCKARATNAEIYVCSPGYTPETDGFNIGIKAGAESAGATYISTYSTQADKLANFGDVVWDASNNEYSFVINSNGRVNHPSDIWHLFMANNILNSLGYSTLDKYRSISCNASVSYRGHTRWVAGGHCTFCTFGNSQPIVSIVDANNNPISYEIMDLSGVTWENTPPSIPKWAVHFDMPDSNVTISIS